VESNVAEEGIKNSKNKNDGRGKIAKSGDGEGRRWRGKEKEERIECPFMYSRTSK
jgi:hypothetical protein